MTTSHSPQLRTAPVPRSLCHLTVPKPGPALISVVALHGNEPAGLQAIERVADHVQALQCGEWLALVGNRAATARAVRYVDRDLIRAWSHIPLTSTGAVEDHEQDELREALDAAFARARGRVYLLDLHTTSGPGAPFTLFAGVFLRVRRRKHDVP